ncbi:MAG: hypothetical protein KGL95_13445, partial [Patescibacteria group bacterium]|nr:hypothetical protein [Patescibacteria group bacterium]
FNYLCKHLFSFEKIVSSVYALGSNWQDFRDAVEKYQIQIETRKFRLFSQIIENNKDIYTKVFTKHQLKFLKDNEIYPFNSENIDYQ